MINATVRHEPEPREHAPVSRTVLWAAILAGPVAWVANHMLRFMYSLGRSSRKGTIRRYSWWYLSRRHIM